MIYGYARVSTREQNLSRQIEALKQHVDDERNIIIDKQSGKDFERKGYNSLVGSSKNAPLLRSGDTLVITSIDRLGRNYTEIQEQWKRLTKELQVNIKVLDIELLDTSVHDDLEGRFMADLVLQILAYVAQKERDSIRERQRQGIAAMKLVDGKRISSKTGMPIGRPAMSFPDAWQHTYDEWRSGKITAKAAMQQLELKRTTFYKLVKLWENK